MQPHSSDAAASGQVTLEVSLLMLTPEEATAGRRRGITAPAPVLPAKSMEARHTTMPEAGRSVARARVS